MRLRTDYHEWYDGVFDDRGPLFVRMAFTRGGKSKREQLAFFGKLGLKTPPHGTVQELAQLLEVPFGGPINAIQRELSCVVYDDELQHGGRGKRLIPLNRALAECPETYASLYVAPKEPGLAIRHLRIGRIGVWLRQSSKSGDWRSNVHDDEQVFEVRRELPPLAIPRVMWAIDFIPSAFGLLAIDFNTAPALITLGENGVLTEGDILAELERVALEHPEQLDQP
jgi:hypothetical protein